MHPNDYAALSEHIRTTLVPNPHVSNPIYAMHDVMVQPDWSAVLVMYDATTPACNARVTVAMFDYCPDDCRAGRGQAGTDTGVRFTANPDNPACDFTGDTALGYAAKHFGEMVSIHGSMEIQNA